MNSNVIFEDSHYLSGENSHAVIFCMYSKSVVVSEYVIWSRGFNFFLCADIIKCCL